MRRFRITNMKTGQSLSIMAGNRRVAMNRAFERKNGAWEHGLYVETGNEHEVTVELAVVDLGGIVEIATVKWLTFGHDSNLPYALLSDREWIGKDEAPSKANGPKYTITSIRGEETKRVNAYYTTLREKRAREEEESAV